MREDRCSFADAETEVAAIDHVQIGAYLVRKWQLPENVIEAVAGHHYHISSSASSGLVDCIVIANALANSGYRINPEDYVFETHVEKALARSLPTLKAGCLRRWKKLRQPARSFGKVMFGLGSPSFR